MTSENEFFSVARAHIFDTFVVTDKEAYNYASTFHELLEVKLGDLTHLSPTSIRDAIDVHLGLRLRWRSPDRQAVVAARLAAEMDEARRRGLLKG